MGDRSSLLNSGTFLTYDSALATDWVAGAGAPGVLGQMPQSPLGIYDTRPWEERPKGMVRNKDWRRETTAAPCGELIIRFTRAPSDAQGSIFFGTPGESDFERFGATTLLIGAWDELNNQDLGNQNQIPETAGQVNVANKATRMGPNITPQLMSTGAAEFDLRGWAGGARFIAVWAWTFWVNVAAVPAKQLIWEVHDRGRQGGQSPLTWAGLVKTVSWPVRVVADGPLVVGDPTAIFRWGSFPRNWFSTYGVANGGPFDADVSFLRRVGVQAFETTALTAPSGSFDIQQTGTGRGNGATGVYGSNTGAEAALGGPIIVSVSGAPGGA